MAEEDKIVLNLEIQARGASGVTTEVKKIQGTFEDLEAELKRLAGLQGGFGPETKKQIAALRRNLTELQAEARATGKSLSEITAKGIGTPNPRIRVATTSLGAGLGSARQREAELRKRNQEEIDSHKKLQQEINRIIRQGEADKRAAERESRAQARKEAREDLEFQKSLQRDINRIKKEALEKEKELNRAHKEALKDDRDYNKQNIADINRQISKQNSSVGRVLNGSAEDRFFAAAKAKEAKNTGANGPGLLNALRPALASAGFIGLNISQQLGSIFDSAKAKGIVAPQIAKLGQVIGGLFGQTFGSIFGNLGDVAGRAFEVVFDSIGTVARVGVKLISGIFTGLSTAIIGLGSTLLLGLNPVTLLGGVLTLAVGAVGGLLSGILTAFGSLVKDLTSIIGNLFGLIGSLLSAGFTAMKAIFDTGLGILKGLWTGFWEGLKAVAELSMNAVAEVVNFGISQVTEGFKDFVLAEKLATKSFVNISGEAENVNRNFAEGTEQVRKLGNQLRIAFGADVADAQGAIFDILSGGFSKVEDANKIIASSGKLAIIGQDSLKESTKAVTSTLLAYGKTADEAEHVGAVISATAKAGRFDLSEFNSSLGTVINQAAVANVPLEELGAAIATISLSGINAKASAVGLNRLLLAMTNPTKANSKAFNDLGIEFTTLDEKGRRVVKPFRELFLEFAKADPTRLRELFGTTQGIRAFNALNQNASKFKGILDSNGNAVQQFDKDFKNVKNTFDFLFRSITQIGLVIRENLGKGFGEILRGPLQAIAPIFERLQKALDGKNVQKFFSSFQAFAKPILDAVINPLIAGLTSIVSYIETADLSKIFKSDGAKELQKDLIGIVNSIYAFPIGINEFYNILKGVGTVSKFLFNEIIIPSLKFLGNPATYVAFVKGLEDAVGVAKILGSILSNSLLDPDTLVTNVNIALSAIGQSFLSLGKFLADVLVKAFDIASAFFESTIIPRLAEALRSILQSSLSGISGFFGNQSLEAQKRIDSGKNSELGDLIDNQLVGIFGTLKETFGSFSDEFKPKTRGDAFEVEPIFKELKSFFKNGTALESQIVTDIVVPKIADKLNVKDDLVESVLNIIKNSSSLNEANDKSVKAGFGTHTGEILQNFLEIISDQNLIKGLKEERPELANKLETLSKEARIGGEQEKGKEDLRNSLDSFVPDLKNSFDDLKKEFGNIAKDAARETINANPNTTFNLGANSNITPPDLFQDDTAIKPPRPGGLSPSSLNPKKSDLLFQDIPVPKDFIPTEDPYEKDKRTEKLEDNTKDMVSLLRDVVDKLTTIASNSSVSGSITGISGGEGSSINVADQGEFA